MLAVLSIAYPFAPIGPDPIGGAEQVLASLDGYLVRDGHVSVVLAASGSRACGHVVAIPPHAGWIDGAARKHAWDAYRRAIADILRDRAIDVVHFHGHDFSAYASAIDAPQIATLHLPRQFYARDAFATAARLVCASHAQRTSFADVDVTDVVENGVPLARYVPIAAKTPTVLALGRICPEKGFELALRAAREAGLPMVLAGAVFPYERDHRYAADVIGPLLDDDRRWIGPVAGARKRRILAEARCLVITSTVAETSSLAAMQALASGTPVVALRRGALPEIVEHGRTGFLVDDLAELPEALVRANELSPQECRAVACERFDAARTAARYVDLYRQVAIPRARRRPGLDVSISTDDGELAAIAGEWDALCDRTPAATPFQRPAWLLPWRKVFGDGGALRAALLRRGGRLVGIVPLELREGTLRLVGDGVTDYLDAVVDPDVAAADLTEAVRRAATGAHAIELVGLRPSSPLRGLHLGGVVAPGPVSPIVSLDTARLPPRLAYEQRRLARHEPSWHDEVFDTANLVAGLFRLHAARWTARGEPGVLEPAVPDPAVERFHREVAARMRERGLLRLIGLSLGGALRAVLYGFADHGRFLYYLAGFDPQIAHLSPGRLLIARALERARDDGGFELDFLRGDETYKYEWGAVDRPSAIYRAAPETEIRPFEEDAHARDTMDHR